MVKLDHTLCVSGCMWVLVLSSLTFDLGDAECLISRKMSVILIRLVGFVPIHACTGDEKDCLYIKYVDLGERWVFSEFPATDGDLLVEESCIKMCIHIVATSGWKISKPEKFFKKKGHIKPRS